MNDEIDQNILLWGHNLRTHHAIDLQLACFDQIKGNQTNLLPLFHYPILQSNGCLLERISLLSKKLLMYLRKGCYNQKKFS
ncbi:hypothetical protein Tanf_00420 [Tannerella forsythia]|nr:hypothetical protein Tanf_00420 [Tannerella forsythia]